MGPPAPVRIIDGPEAHHLVDFRSLLLRPQCALQGDSEIGGSGQEDLLVADQPWGSQFERAEAAPGAPLTGEPFKTAAPARLHQPFQFHSAIEEPPGAHRSIERGGEGWKK